MAGLVVFIVPLFVLGHLIFISPLPVIVIKISMHVLAIFISSEIIYAFSYEKLFRMIDVMQIMQQWPSLDPCVFPRKRRTIIRYLGDKIAEPILVVSCFTYRKFMETWLGIQVNRWGTN